MKGTRWKLLTSFSANERAKGTHQPRGLIPIRRNMSQQIEIVALRCVITQCRNPEYRESTFPFKDVFPRSHSPFKLIYVRDDGECRPGNFFSVNFLTVLRQKFTQSKDVSHKIYTLQQVYFCSKTNQMQNISNLFCFGTTLYMFRTVFPSIIRSL
jgi:hypothetical protein